MAEYHCQPLADLARQLRFAPPGRRREQMDRAERLYWQLDPQRGYPLSYLVYQITGYRADAAEDESGPTTLAGEAVRSDLLTFVDELSLSLDDRAGQYDPTPLDITEVAGRLNVTERTVRRYRSEGLFTRRLLCPTGRGERRKVMVLPESLERFAAARSEQLDEAARFERIDEPTRHAIITRARRIASRSDASLFAVAEHLADKYGRSVETVRRLLVKHDEHDPRFAIFRGRRPPLGPRDRRLILRAYRRGVPVAKLAKRLGRSRDAIYRSIHVQRTEQLRTLGVDYVHGPTFDLPDADEVILGPSTEEPGDASDDDRGDLAALPTAATEQAWFARYNFLKFRARQQIDQLDPNQPRPARIDRLLTRLRQARQVQRLIHDRFTPVAIAVARRHLAAHADGQSDLLQLIQRGQRLMDRQIEQFAFARGGRFATSLNWSLMRQFARAASADPPEPTWLERFDAIDPLPATDGGDALVELLGELDERQRWIVTRHFGLDESGRSTIQPRTAASIAAELDLPVAQVRRIERRALLALRRQTRGARR